MIRGGADTRVEALTPVRAQPGKRAEMSLGAADTSVRATSRPCIFLDKFEYAGCVTAWEGVPSAQMC